MKFFVQLVSCCGCSSKRADLAAEEEEILVPEAAVASSDMNNIITYKRRRRRRRGSARSAGSFPEWKPSLSSISEDADHAPAVNSGRNLKKKKKAVIAAWRPINQLPHRLVSMKFFVQLVSCCGCSSKRAHRAAEEEEILVPEAAVASSDMNNIITYKRRRRRRRGSARSAGSFPEWKPSLSSISEDADHAPAANSGRNLKKKKKVVIAVHRLKSRFSRIACLAAMVPAPFLI